MSLVLVTGFALTGCVSGSPTASDSIPPPAEPAYSESEQTAVELQRLTKQLTPVASASRPDDVPTSERVVRQLPNKLGIVVIPVQPEP